MIRHRLYYLLNIVGNEKQKYVYIIVSLLPVVMILQGGIAPYLSSTELVLNRSNIVLLYADIVRGVFPLNLYLGQMMQSI